MEYVKLCYTVEDHVAIIKLNTPDKLNTLSHRSWDELVAAFGQAQTDNEVFSILLCAEGKAFSAGFDLDESIDLKDDTPWRQWQQLKQEKDDARFIWKVNKPVVAAVQGFCLGSGLELMLLADMVVAADDAKFGETEVRFSMMPFPTLLYLVGARKAKEMILLAERIDAQEALRVGLVNKVVLRDELEAQAMQMAHRLAMLPTETMQMTKAMLNKAIDHQGLELFYEWFFDLLHVTKSMPTMVSTEFERIKKESGMKEALAWMKERYR